MSKLDDLITALTSGDDERAESAVPQLVELGHEALVALEPLLVSGDADQRWWGLRCLAQFDAPPLEPFVAALRDERLDIRQCAAMGLMHHPSVKTIPDLIQSLSDPDSMVATLAANALISLGTESVPALVDVLEKGKRSARLEAARALSVIKDHRAIPALMKAMQEDSALMQYWAEQGLDKLGLGMLYIKPE